VSHSYKEVFSDCIKCPTSGSLTRLFSVPISIQKSTHASSTVGRKRKVGSVVVAEIEEIKKEIKHSHKELKGRNK